MNELLSCKASLSLSLLVNKEMSTIPTVIGETSTPPEFTKVQ
ncbi:hypothetical protein ACG1BZ_10305 [Microbulbifer sp. CNSA002]